MIALGAVENFRLKGQCISEIVAGPGGLLLASISFEGTSQSGKIRQSRRKFEVSIWSTSCGMNRVGFITLEVLQLKLDNRNTASSSQNCIIWHPSGSQICTIIASDVYILNLAWNHPDRTGEYNYDQAALRNDEGEDEDDVARLLNCSLSITLRKRLNASSSTLTSCSRYILIGSDRGIVYRIGWNGEILSRFAIHSEHYLFRTWQPTVLVLSQAAISMSVSEHIDISERNEVVSRLSSPQKTRHKSPHRYPAI